MSNSGTAPENLPVAPAALTLQAAGPGLSPEDRIHLTAATLFSRITGEPAPMSADKQALANLSHKMVTEFADLPTQDGPFPFPHPFAIQHDSRQHFNFSHKGTSTERDLSAAAHAANAHFIAMIEPLDLEIARRLTGPEDLAVGVFIVTLCTGACPVQTVSTDTAFAGREELDLFCQRIGYELACQLGHIQTRAPHLHTKEQITP